MSLARLAAMVCKVFPWLLLLLVVPASVADGLNQATTPVFGDNFVAQYGADGHHLVDQGKEVTLTMDQSTGAGFRSKSEYGSGFFHLRFKIPSGYTAGVVTTFYLISQPEDSGRDEVDFEFLGDVDGKPVTVQTNVIINGRSFREQRLHLWFDPAADFHDYKILWNPFQLMMFVDDTPVRVFRNMTGTVAGYEYPSKKTMLIRGSLWDGSSWATGGGRLTVDWSKGPFNASYRGFAIDGCAAEACDYPGLWWNGGEYRAITDAQRAAYKGVKRKYMVYNYCTDTRRFNNHMPPECYGT
ncbi:hypothetical protein ACP4OV_012888 [Aristida adscensionis]